MNADKTGNSDLDGVVIAFDLDNTLLDPTGQAYHATVTEFLSLVGSGRELEKSYELYEEFRIHADALERLGFRNPNHERGNAEALAAFCLSFGREYPAALGVAPAGDSEAGHRSVLEQLTGLNRETRAGTLLGRWKAEWALRQFVAGDPCCRALCAEVAELSRHPAIRQWSDRYPGMERKQPIFDTAPVVRALAARGATVVVITEGRTKSQLEKLERIGLRTFFQGRVLVSDKAAKFPGIYDFHDRVDQMFASAISGEPPDRIPDPALWAARCVLEEWTRKSPAFYARCLHAVAADPNNCERALEEATVVPQHAWPEVAPRFVMIGDRYDIDIRPLCSLLGVGQGFKIRLLGGKYGSLYPDRDLSVDARPDRSASSWAALEELLRNELHRNTIPTIDTSPKIFQGLDEAAAILSKAADRSCALVRHIATMAHRG